MRLMQLYNNSDIYIFKQIFCFVTRDLWIYLFRTIFYLKQIYKQIKNEILYK